MSILDTAEYRRLALIAAGVDPSQIPAILDTATWRRLMLAALYDLSQGGGGSPGFINGSVQFYADLPVTVGTPPVNTAYLVREDSGIWFINRKPAGIYVRLFNNGTLDDWDYAGEFPSVNDSQYFRIYDSADPTKELAFDVSDISSGTTRTLDAPNRNGRVSVSDYRLLSANANAVTGDKVAADTGAGVWTLTLPATPANGDTVSILDYAGTFDTNVLTIARNGSNIESLAENMDCNIEDAAFSLVYVGAVVGWKVVPYFGSKTDLASAGPIGSTIPSTGAFTTLTATPNAGSTALTLTGGTVTASAPLLDATQAWNNSGVSFTGLRFNITNTAADHRSLPLSIDDGGVPSFGVQSVIGVPIVQATRLFGGSRGLRFGARQTGASGSTDFCAMRWQTNIFSILHGVEFGWSSLPYDTAPDLSLHRDAADTLAQRRLANPQTFRLYNTTDAGLTNYERGFMRWSSNVLQIGTEKGSGGGMARGMELRTDNVARINISSTGGIGFFGAAAAAQPTAVADATDAATVITQLNALLSRMRTLGLIANT